MKIAVIVLDTLRKDRVSVYNDGVDFTPNLEKFSEDAEVFENAFNHSPWSLPSQVSFLTGMYPWQHGASQENPFVDSSTEMIQEKLEREGYETGAVHNNTYLQPITGAMEGFQHIRTPFNYGKYLKNIWRYSKSSDILKKFRKKSILFLSDLNTSKLMENSSENSKVSKEASDFIDSNSDRKFFLYANIVSSHFPYNPPEKYKKRHKVDAEVSDLESRPLEYGGGIKEDEREDIEKLYDAEVELVDSKFGQVIEKLKDENIYEETMIVVFSDHGELLGENGKFGHHFSTHENLVKVPLMIKYPEGENSGRKKEVTELRQVHYRILEKAGLDANDRFNLLDGHALGFYGKPEIYGERVSEDIKPEMYVCGSESISRFQLSMAEISAMDEEELREKLGAEKVQVRLK